MKHEERPFNLDLPDSFWLLIDAIRAQPDRAIELLTNLTQLDLDKCYYDYRTATVELYPEYADEERGMSEDAVARASAWVVSQGKSKYLEVWDDPSLLPYPYTLPYIDYSGIAAQVYYDRFGTELVG